MPDLKPEDLLDKLQKYANQLALDNHYVYFKIDGYSYSFMKDYDDGEPLPWEGLYENKNFNNRYTD